MEYPHVPAAFINAIAEEGTKAEAVEYLQKQWNETCALRAALKQIADMGDEDNEWDGRDKFRNARAFAQRAISDDR